MLKCIGFYKGFLFMLLFSLTPVTQGSAPLSCPVDPPPGECDVTDQFTSGRMAFTQLNGSYEINGTEEYIYDEDYDWLISDEFETSGTLEVELVDGAEANYLDINCDGTVTGQGKDKISGIINKTYIDSAVCPNGTIFEIPANEMDWNIEINRSYSITGTVTNTGELELELSIDTAELSILNDSTFIDNPDCCAPIIKGERPADTAETLMRSRYTAFVKGEIDYILNSVHPEKREEHDEKSIRAWSQKASWHGLEILETEKGGPDDTDGTVEFVANFSDNEKRTKQQEVLSHFSGKEKRTRHHELASFKKVDDRWYFYDGEGVKPKQFRREAPKVGRNEPCPCGSGKKYKKCCA